MQRRERYQLIERRDQRGRHPLRCGVIRAAMNDPMPTGFRMRQLQLRDSLERRMGRVRSVLERAFFVDENLSTSHTDHQSAAAQSNFLRDALRDQRLAAITDLIKSELARRGAAVKAQ